MVHMIDLTYEDVVTVDGHYVPVALIRVLADHELGRVRLEFDDGSVEEMEIRRDGAAVHFIRHPRSGRGTDQQPIATEFRAELASPDNRMRRWVTRGDSDDTRLRREGWTETARTRWRTPPPPEEPDPLAR